MSILLDEDHQMQLKNDQELRTHIAHKKGLRWVEQRWIWNPSAKNLAERVAEEAECASSAIARVIYCIIFAIILQITLFICIKTKMQPENIGVMMGLLLVGPFALMILAILGFYGKIIPYWKDHFTAWVEQTWKTPSFSIQVGSLLSYLGYLDQKKGYYNSLDLLTSAGPEIENVNIPFHVLKAADATLLNKALRAKRQEQLGQRHEFENTKFTLKCMLELCQGFTMFEGREPKYWYDQAAERLPTLTPNELIELDRI